MSRSSGAGSPVFFRCSRCKKTHGVRDGRRYVTTGRKREAHTAKGHATGIRSANSAYEYRCLECGFVGWSRHRDVERKFRSA